MHCLREEVAGEWTFDLGADNEKGDVNCRDFAAQTQMKVRLELPFTATELDDQGNAVGENGTWTMIYDEGWELRVGGKKYFSFCKFTQEQPAGQAWQITSYCHATLNGWYHNEDGTNWGCYNGTRSGDPATRTTSGEPNYGDYSDAPMADTTALLEEQAPLYKPETQLIEAVNRRRLSWTAKAYPQWEGMTMRDMQRMMGFGRVPKEAPPRAARDGAGAARVDDVEALLLQMSQGEMGAGSGNDKNQPMDAGLYTTRSSVDDYPDTWDWRDMNGQDFTHPAINQGGCGSCWAVSTADMLSMRTAIATNNTWKPKLSAQEMLVCSDKYAQACAGGFPYLAMKYVQDYGLGDDQCYPYAGRDEQCQLAAKSQASPDKCSKRIGVSEYKYIGGGYGAATVVAMMEEVYSHGPMTVCIEPSSALMHYSAGIFEEDEELNELQIQPWEKTDHAVVVVGWSTGTHGDKYWIVKNSWGSFWGDKGYFYTPLGKNSMSIENMPSAGMVTLPVEDEATADGASANVGAGAHSGAA